jgi:phage recombination protein Bet
MTTLEMNSVLNWLHFAKNVTTEFTVNQGRNDMENQLTILSNRLNVEPEKMKSIIMNTVMPAPKDNKGKPVTEEQFTSFLAVANEYNLNPLMKEIYAFPTRGGGIQAIVSIDGWLKLINGHPQFDGMETAIIYDDKGNVNSAICKIYVKNRSRPTIVEEFFSECNMGTDIWKKRPARMLRHKAVQQCGRYAFGLTGIGQEDDLLEENVGSGTIEKDITPPRQDDVVKKSTAQQTISKIMEKSKAIKKPDSEVEVEQKSSDEIQEGFASFDLKIWELKIQSCDDNETLKKVFSDAWKNACKSGTESDKKAVKKSYDDMKVFMDEKG